MAKFPVLAALLAALLVFAGCSADETTGPTALENPSGLPMAPEGEGQTEFSREKATSGDIVDTAIASGFGTLVAAVQAAGLESALRADGPFTVFAPTDAAFAALPSGLVDQLLLPQNQAKLQQILLYHVVEGAVRSSDLRFFQRVPTLEGSTVDVLRFFNLIKVNDARVVLADVAATNGVIHVVDRVLVPEGFTLDEPAGPSGDIVDTAIEQGFDTLVAAVQAAGLVDALRGEGPLTVFAPTEQAFSQLPAELLGSLLQPANVGLLRELLLYHVVGEQIESSSLRRSQFVKMLNEGYTLVRKTWKDEVKVNRATVVAADVLTTNGVIHAIDRVLIPYSFYGRVAGLPAEAPADHPERQRLVTAD